MKDQGILIGQATDNEKVYLNLKMANRHGLIAGATGTGKTVTLQVLAEQFAAAGVPVFTADVKGDLSGLAAAGKDHPKVKERTNKMGLDDFQFKAASVVFWDLFAENGHPIRTTIEDMGSQLLARLFDCSDAQEGILTLAFKIAKEKQMPLLDISDLRSMLQFLTESKDELQAEYGTINKGSVGALLRDVLTLEEAGAKNFFGEPALNVKDWLKKSPDGSGLVHVLDGRKLIQDSRLYSIFLLWLMSELFEELPEVGDMDKPKLVFFFDEAHLLFKDTPKLLLEKIEMVVKLVRSKGVGIYFVTQNPADIPDGVLSQLGNKIQHALRAFTEKDQKAIRAAAKSFRINPNLDIAKTLTTLGVGESLVSVLDEKGTPTETKEVLNAPPMSQIGPLSAEAKTAMIESSLFGTIYGKTVDRESAHEMILKRREERSKEEEKEEKKSSGGLSNIFGTRGPRGGRKRQGLMEYTVKAIIRGFSSRLMTQIFKAFLKR